MRTTIRRIGGVEGRVAPNRSRTGTPARSKLMENGPSRCSVKRSGGVPARRLGWLAFYPLPYDSLCNRYVPPVLLAIRHGFGHPRACISSSPKVPSTSILKPTPVVEGLAAEYGFSQ